MASEEIFQTIVQKSRKIGQSLSSFGESQNFDDLFYILPDRENAPEVKLNISRVKGGYVVLEPGRDGLIFDSDGEIIKESTAWSSGDHIKYNISTLRDTARDINGPVFVAIDSAWTNYYHWVILSLCKAAVCASVLPSDFKCIFPDFRLRTQRGHSARFSYDVWLQTLLRFDLFSKSHILDDGVYRFDEIYYAHVNHKQPAYITYMGQLYDVARKLRSNIGISEEQTNKFVIKRIDNKRINSKFERICEKLIEEHGYKPIHLERMNFYDQCASFRTAKIIVAPHGAGLSNMILGSRHLKILELNSYVDRDNFLRPWFYMISEGMGQKYRYINISTHDGGFDDMIKSIIDYENC